MKQCAMRKLPKRDVSLSTMGLGCAQLGGLYKEINGDEALAIVDAAWESGIRYFDTAPYYGYTLSECRLGNALRTRARNSYVVSTKVGRIMLPDSEVRRGENGWANPLPYRPHFDYTYDGVMRSHEDSLRRLGLDHVDILYVHDIGRMTHGARQEFHWRELTKGGGFSALLRLRDEGSVSAIGLGVNEWEAVTDAMDVCDIDCALLAGRYTLLEQEALAPLLDRCEQSGVGIVIGGPFNSGILAGNRKFNYSDAPLEILARVAEIEEICTAHASPIQAAALQFPMAHPAVVSCLAGAQSPAQVRQNTEWMAQPLPLEIWQALRQRGLINLNAPTPSI